MSFSSIEQKTTYIFQKLLNKARNELYPGCLEFFSLNFLVKLMHIEVFNGLSNKSFDMLLELLKVVFPMGTTILSSFYEAKQKLRDFGLEYDSISFLLSACIIFVVYIWMSNQGPTRLLERNNLFNIIVGPSCSYNKNRSSLKNEVSQWDVWSCLKKHKPVEVAN